MLLTSLKKAALALVVTLSLTGSLRADDFPGLGVGDLWANEIAFQNQFYAWAAEGSRQVALMTPNDQPLPFNAMTISNSLTQGSQAFEGYIHHSQQMTNRQIQAVENYSNTAIRGYAPYYDNSGYNAPVMLPWGPSAYTPMYDGFAPSANVFVPSNNAWQYQAWTPWGY